ncbi:hypothetical protein CK203_024973 [Vitis vinifera]|uniref:Uncharacterized protein n=1 Tax=Vitis vinifera TaxID=29760 RepID=A0A438J6Y0_VITVI|nr:hypothetical protein CK203_024973 [Vitis vinifera]
MRRGDHPLHLGKHFAPQEISCRPPAKKAKVSGPRESSAPPQPQPPAIEPFHSELCFDMETFRQQPELRDSFRLLEIPFGAPDDSRDFFYPRVALDFYQSMTTVASNPNVIHFTIDGRHGILGARHIAEALHIPYEPGTSTRSFLLRKELPPGMLLVDVVLRSNIFPLQHMVQGDELYWRLYSGYQRSIWAILLSLSLSAHLLRAIHSRQMESFNAYVAPPEPRYDTSEPPQDKQPPQGTTRLRYLQEIIPPAPAAPL